MPGIGFRTKSAPLDSPTFTTGVTINGICFKGTCPAGGPTTGTGAVGDYRVDTTFGQVWVCSVAGSPGTWVNQGKEIAAVQYTSGTQTSSATPGSGTTQPSYADFSPSLTLTFGVPSLPIIIGCKAYCYASTATGTPTTWEGVLGICNDANTATLLASDYFANPRSGAAALNNMNCNDRHTAARLGVSVGSTYTARVQQRPLIPANGSTNGTVTMSTIATSTFPATLYVSLA